MGSCGVSSSKRKRKLPPTETFRPGYVWSLCPRPRPASASKGLFRTSSPAKPKGQWVTYWRKSSHSSSEPQTCVECATLAAAPNAVVAIRDSTDPRGPRLVMTPEAWRALLVRLKDDA
ncbi:DUF397 domain-containing protein [Actinomadura sp. 7K534]|uniref:DUF397 domain-containing protein n=1 Tax=Actinomadura sp. 7K534 TaxID=2530366 RepID=UPI001053EA5E|nr:DUF397 domain-containing protein [Actinomadura sp. 7K534]TDB94038.1 DUF397 domain-containing protein [Actinomadura sp. 7K534]